MSDPGGRTAPDGPSVRLTAVFTYVWCALMGFASGLVGSFIQLTEVGSLPVGVVVALVLLGAALVGSGYTAGSRLGAVLCGLGWFAAVVVLALPRVEGDVVLPSAGPTYAWLYGGTLLMGGAIALPYRRLRGRQRVPPR